MFLVYGFNIGLNVASIIVAQYYNFSSTQANWVFIVAIISIIFHFFLMQFYKKIGSEEVTKESFQEQNIRLGKYESLRKFSTWGAAWLCFMLIAFDLWGK